MVNTAENQRKRAAQRKAAGICIRCGVIPVDSYVNCWNCRLVLAEYKRKSRKKAKDDML